ncbi:Ig-like domain-containing protein [Williamwhitmania taraxaci]|uniref:Ig-like domain-containing protein n=2 Tax=Williamwhitmania taraxaci TaxID=1640674 RepID=A0A1G6RF10_9BACT|nr:Ig-like domain-containing protein [Williamwhitmania taraxaci]
MQNKTQKDFTRVTVFRNFLMAKPITMRKLSLALLVLSALFGSNALAQVNEDFESGSSVLWTQSPISRWEASTDRPLSGIYSLKHTYDNTLAAVDFVGINMNLPSISEGNVRWRFLIKHGYAPSASNRWSVFLMSTANATEMNGGNLFSGYSVGINTTGSDDKLRIYKHSISPTNTPLTEVLLETNFNWESEVGTTKSAAIEVTRSASGAWTLKVSKDGLFANLVTLGTFQNSDFGTLQNLVVAYTYTSSADRNLWLDDISVTYSPLNTNNLTSTVNPPTTQIASQQIFTTDTSSVLAKELLRFRITDKASGDGLSTKPTRLIFRRNGSGPNLGQTLEEVILKNGFTPIPVKAATIDENSITVEIDEGAIVVADGSEQEFSIWATLKKSTTVTDHTPLGLEIPNINHGWSAALTGSGYATAFPESINAQHTIEVLANRLTVKQQPHIVQKSSPFSIVISATDDTGNVDQDFTGTVTLTLNEGTGNLSIPDGSTQTMANGMASWNNITYSGMDSFILKATNASLGQITTQSISLSNDSTSILSLAGNQPITKELSPGCTTTSCAVELMRLVATDAGGDGLPTIVTQIRLVNGAASLAADWTKAIRFFAIKINGKEVSLGNPTITKTAATIPILPGDLIIIEGQSAEISILVGLNDKVTDREILQIQIESPIHGFTTSTSGSAFVANLPHALISNAFPINIVASKLVWKSIPIVVAVNEPFQVEVNAVDQLGNLDSGFSAQATLTFTNLKEKTTTMTTVSAGGKAIFAGNTLPYSGEYRVASSSGTLLETPTAILLVGDKNSTITHSANTVIEAPLPSNGNRFIPILSLDIHDFGTTDTLPTIITKATLKIISNDTLVIAPPISEIEVRTADGMIIPTTTTFSSIGLLETTFSSSVYINNNSSKNLLFYGKPSHYPVTDNTVFQFKVSAKDCGWAVSSNSSLLAQIQPFDVLSPPFTTTVEAKIIHPMVKPLISFYEPLVIGASAVDSMKNIDIDYSNAVDVSITNIASGEKRDYSTTFINGRANLQPTEEFPTGRYSGTLVTVNLPKTPFNFEIAQDKTCPLSETFESGTTPITWIGTDSWKIDNTSALGSPKSIRHNGLPEGKQSTLTIPTEANLRTDSYTLSCKLKTGNWLPSTDNNFALLLANNSNILSLDALTGYAIGVNQSGDDDTLKVWQIEKGKNIKTLISTQFKWKENSQAAIELILFSNGERTLFINEEEYQFTDTTLTAIKSFSIRFNYTSTRAGLLWADDINLCRFASGPKLISATRSEKRVASLKFSEPVASTSQLEDKIHLWSEGNPIQPISLVNKNGNIQFVASTDLPRRATLSWRNLTDSEGNQSADSITIDFGPFIEFGSTVFNEVMADPTPVAGLPECEYVELVSRTIDTLNLDGWTLLAANNRATLRNIILPPNKYLLLTTTTCATQPKLAEKGAIGVTSFPSLTNAGTILSLKDIAGRTITQVTYSDDWYRDGIKKEGGFSLEKIDYDNLSEDSLNWIASENLAGGTPGEVNSVSAANPDITPPTLKSISVLNEQTITLEFSEPLQLATITNEKFAVDGNLGVITMQSATAPAVNVRLAFASPMTTNTIYHLAIGEGITDLAGNNLSNVEVPFAMTRLAQWQEIVINELLFNPHTGGADFIEIYNRSTSAFNLKQLKLFRRDNSNALTSGIRLTSYDRLIVDKTVEVVPPISVQVVPGVSVEVVPLF